MTIEAGIYNGLVIYTGGTLSQPIVWTADDVPVNLTGYTAVMQIRQTADNATVVLELSSDDGTIVITPLLGKITLTLTYEQTKDLPPGTYVYDIRLSSTAETEVDFLLQGRIKIQQMVTQWPQP